MGHDIPKLECAHHSCKCYHGALERLVQEKPYYKGSSGITQKMRRHLVSPAKSAISMRSMEDDKKPLKNLSMIFMMAHSTALAVMITLVRISVSQLKRNPSRLYLQNHLHSPHPHL